MAEAKLLPDEPTCIYNPVYRPYEDRGWKIVMVKDVPEWLEKGWVTGLREALDIREQVRQEIVAEDKAESAGVAVSEAEEAPPEPASAPAVNAEEPVPETPSEPARDSSGAAFDPEVHVSETSVNKDGTFRKKPGKKAA